MKKIAVASPTVPAGICARQTQTKLKLWEELEQQNKFVPGEHVCVTLALRRARRGQGGIVHGTVARISKRVQEVYTFEPATQDQIVYPLVLLQAGHKNAATGKVFEYLQSAPAEAAREMALQPGDAVVCLLKTTAMQLFD